ncbi:MAG: hypothetical protein GVY04_19285 [Cyanobacteria bacterium]|jgi:hypothetical protein|nr:hypothetical protein [Cyanobacteria bacterium GSL.Bin1]
MTEQNQHQKAEQNQYQDSVRNPYFEDQPTEEDLADDYPISDAFEEVEREAWREMEENC